MRRDDAAGTAGAVEHQQGLRGRGSLGSAQHHLHTGRVAAHRDVHGGVLLEPANVHHSDIAAGHDQRLEPVRGDEGHTQTACHQLAESLAWCVDVSEQLVAGVRPRRDPATEHAYPPVTEPAQLALCQSSRALASVEQDDGSSQVGYPVEDFQLETVEGERGSKQRMALGVLVLRPYVEQRELPAGSESCPHVLRRADSQRACPMDALSARSEPRLPLIP